MHSLNMGVCFVLGEAPKRNIGLANNDDENN